MSAGEWSSTGKRIAFRREDLGLNQTALARLCGVNPMTVSKWERDVLRPTRKIVELEKALCVTAAWILTGHFELRATKEGRDEASRAMRRILEHAKWLCKAIESLPTGERLPRDVMETIFAQLEFLQADAGYARNFLPDPALFMRTQKQMDREIRRMTRSVDGQRKVRSKEQ